MAFEENDWLEEMHADRLPPEPDRWWLIWLESNGRRVCVHVDPATGEAEVGSFG